jgi:hypothetical protein
MSNCYCHPARGGGSPHSLVGGLGALVTFLPRFSVTAGEIVDSQNTFSASFTIANLGFIQLRHVQANLGLGAFKSSSLGLLDPKANYTYKPELAASEWAIPRLNMDQTFTFTPDQVFRYTVVNDPLQADIAIIVSFQPWILPWKQEKLFRFKTYKQTNGNLYWYAVPPN